MIQKLHGEVFNFGPKNNQNKNVLELVKEIKRNWSNAKWKINKNSKLKNKESNLLKLNSNKAKKYLNWSPILNFKESVNLTSNWYVDYYKKGKRITDNISKNNIIEYNNILVKKVKNLNLKYNILVTGGTGFIGRNFISLLEKKII